MSEIKGKANTAGGISLPETKAKNMEGLSEKTLNQNLSARNLSPKDQREPRKLEAAKMFENQFIRQMISEMRKTVPEDGLIQDGMGAKIFKEKLDDEYADKWVERGGIGLADVIYDQLEQRYDKRNLGPAKNKGEFLNLKTSAADIDAQKKNSSDLFHNRDKDLFLVKKTNTGFQIKSREPLPENVVLQAPFGGEVVSAAALGEGKQMVILRHPDQGLTSQFVHTGQNAVQPGQVVSAGDRIADLKASQAGEFASVVFGLRRRDAIE